MPLLLFCVRRGGKCLLKRAEGVERAHFILMLGIWSLTLSQVAATLAATPVGFDTLNSAGQRLIDEKILDVVFVLIVVTATIGPIMTQHYAPLLRASSGSTGCDKAA